MHVHTYMYNCMYIKRNVCFLSFNVRYSLLYYPYCYCYYSYHYLRKYLNIIVLMTIVRASPEIFPIPLRSMVLPLRSFQHCSDFRRKMSRRKKIVLVYPFLRTTLVYRSYGDTLAEGITITSIEFVICKKWDGIIYAIRKRGKLVIIKLSTVSS